MRRKRTALLTILLLAGLVAVPVVLTWREVRQEQLNQALIAAVDRNDTAGVRRLLRRGADPNAPVMADDKRPIWKRLWDMLHKAAPHPVEQTAVLFEAVVGPPIDEQAIDLAIKQGKPVEPLLPPVTDNVDMVTALVDAGANVNFRGSDKKATALIVAAYFGRFETMKVLLAHHADVNAVDVDGDLALASTAAGANATLVEALLQHGARVNQVGKLGQTALYAVLSPFQSRSLTSVRATVACLLRHGASVTGKDADGNTVMTLAYRFHDPQLIQMLKQAGAKE